MKRGFTLVELLVVVAIITVLISILLPSMDRATRIALRAKCLANERNMTQGALTYAVDNKSWLPPSEFNGQWTYSFDYRLYNALPSPGGLGLLVPAGLMPSTQIGRLIHCPLYDTSGSGGDPNNGAYTTNHGMNVNQSNWWNGMGGDWFVDPAFNGRRVIGAYNYRSTSYFRQEKSAMKTSDLGGKQVVLTDTFDPRFGIKYGHGDEYNRTFSDGSGAPYADPEKGIENYLATRGAGAADGYNTPATDEEVFTLMKRGDKW